MQEPEVDEGVRVRQIARRQHGQVDKVDAAATYVAGGARAVSAKYPGVPISTVRSWATALGTGKPLNGMGRPPHLSDVEESMVTTVVRRARANGHAVDGSLLLHIASEVHKTFNDGGGRVLGNGWMRYVIK